ncbi:hypothetical protein MANES_05G119402v8 [Manihot esculenta]|uniref:Uncharacterized protein n=1 Tax=Manihot esculenta TaxID=3983 RepID=A0A2C9VVF9_MANES|nr:hypothetical protein MANES_05G119402v8 [Manihot esculenta]
MWRSSLLGFYGRCHYFINLEIFLSGFSLEVPFKLDKGGIIQARRKRRCNRGYLLEPTSFYMS